jgi:regulator of protease activity HflC (stomatin/prohibitin superfamily)
MGGDVFLGFLVGAAGWFAFKYVIRGFYTVNQNERAVKTTFGRAERINTLQSLASPGSQDLRDSEKERYVFPTVHVIQPGGPYFKGPWEKIYKVSVATETVNMAFDPDSRSANQGNTMLDAVTKDQLNTGLSGQLRFRVSEENIYAYLFGVKRPIAHVMGFFIAILRQRIASFSAPHKALVADTAADMNQSDINAVAGISINDLRKNLRSLNEHMEEECRASVGRYGIVFDASLITGIDPPPEVESALAAINTAHNHVSADISLAQAAADQRIVQSRRAVEVETLKAHAEVEPLVALSAQLSDLKKNGAGTLQAYLRNVRLGLISKAKTVFIGGRS